LRGFSPDRKPHLHLLCQQRNCKLLQTLPLTLATANADEAGSQATNDYLRKRGKETIAIMWKPNQTGPNSPSTPEPARPTPPAASPSTFEPGAARPSTGAASSAAATAGEQATIGKSLVVKGEVSGSESLYIDGKVEGAINLPGNRVTVGRNGQVAANIMAREVVVLGKVRGNINASDRVDIRSEGSLTGDVAAARISIEDGAYFKGGIDIRKPGDAKNGAATTTSVPEPAIAEAKA
jgi:cytoskeletal protein CcmA (bactofilin family)